ncbi:MAG: STAS/SEC14 domain-containing protein [Syntrophorhabdales bacterium]|jgi:hypothetical protein
MMTAIPDVPDNVVAVKATGKITGDDYETVLIPVIEEKLKKHDKIRLLYQIGPDIAGFTAGAMWDDAKVGLRHLTAFDKIAVVSDVEWITGVVKIFSFVIPALVRTFGNEDFLEAKAWVSS